MNGRLPSSPFESLRTNGGRRSCAISFGRDQNAIPLPGQNPHGDALRSACYTRPGWYDLRFLHTRQATCLKCHPERSEGSKVPGNMDPTPLAPDAIDYGVIVLPVDEVLQTQILVSSVA